MDWPSSTPAFVMLALMAGVFVFGFTAGWLAKKFGGA